MSTYYVSHHASADDANGGTDATTDSWATLEHALGAVSNEDRIILVGDGTHVVDATITANTGCMTWGSNSSGVIDGTMVRIQADPSITGSGPMIDINQPEIGFAFCILDGNDSIDDVVSHHSASMLFSCVVTGAEDNAIENTSGARQGYCVFTTLEDNGDGDSSSMAAAARNMTFYRCVARDNAGRGFGGGSISAFACLSHDNGEQGFSIQGGAADGNFVDCVADNNAADGFAHGDGSISYSIGCVAVRNGGYGFTEGTSGNLHFSLLMRCYYGTGAWANTSGGVEGGIYYAPEWQHDVTSGSSPDFDDPDASASDENDYTPGASSDLLGIGLPIPFAWNDRAAGEQMDLGPISVHEVGADVEVDVEAGSLTLTEHTATVSLDVEVEASAEVMALTTYDATVMVGAVQYARPESDVSSAWTGGYAEMDETVPSDADFAYSADGPSDAVLEVALSSLSDPATHTGHVLRWREALTDAPAKASSEGNGATLRVDLVQGTTIIATRSAESAWHLGDWATRSLELSEGEAAAITDYSDLRVRLTASGSASGNPIGWRGAGVSWVEFEAPAGVTVDVGVASLTLTEQDATISFDVEVDVAAESLNLASYDATVDVDVEVEASAKTLTLTTHAATVSLDLDVSADAASLTLVTHDATVDTGEDDVEVSVNVAAVTVTTHAATVSLDVPVSVDAAALTLTTHDATVHTGESDVSVSVDAAALTLATLEATVAHDVAVACGIASLAITTHPASIAGDVAVDVSLESLELVTHDATVSIDIDVPVDAAALPLTTYAATLGIDVEIAVGASALELMAWAASITTIAAVAGPYTTVAVDLFVPGAVAGQMFQNPAAAGLFVPGAVAGQMVT